MVQEPHHDAMLVTVAACPNFFITTHPATTQEDHCRQHVLHIACVREGDVHSVVFLVKLPSTVPIRWMSPGPELDLPIAVQMHVPGAVALNVLVTVAPEFPAN